MRTILTAALLAAAALSGTTLTGSASAGCVTVYVLPMQRQEPVVERHPDNSVHVYPERALDSADYFADKAVAFAGCVV